MFLRITSCSSMCRSCRGNFDRILEHFNTILSSTNFILECADFVRVIICYRTFPFVRLNCYVQFFPYGSPFICRHHSMFTSFPFQFCLHFLEFLLSNLLNVFFSTLFANCVLATVCNLLRTPCEKYFYISHGCWLVVLFVQSS